MNKRRDHDEIEALLALRALGGIEADDERRLQQELAAHGEDCQDCRRLAAELHEVAGRLAFALAPEPVPSELEERVVAGLPRYRSTAPRTTPRSIVRQLVAVAAAATIAFVAGWTIRGVGAPTGPADALAGARVVALQGSPARLSVAYRPGGSGAFLFGAGLAAPPANRVYELWIIRDGTPIPQTCFTPQDGNGAVLAFVDTAPRSTDTVAVTVEPTSCPSAPTTRPVLTASLASA